MANIRAIYGDQQMDVAPGKKNIIHLLDQISDEVSTSFVFLFQDNKFKTDPQILFPNMFKEHQYQRPNK